MVDVHFHELIAFSGLYFAPAAVKKKVNNRDTNTRTHELTAVFKNPKFEAYMEKLRNQQQERRYNKMVSNVISSEDQKFHLGIETSELRQVKSHLATTFNIIFSMVAVYVAVYKASKTITTDIGLVRAIEAVFCNFNIHYFLFYLFTSAGVGKFRGRIPDRSSRSNFVCQICIYLIA